MALNIGDKVFVIPVEKDQLFPHTITDKCYSEKYGEFRYEIDDRFGVSYTKNELVLTKQQAIERNYSFVIDIADDVVIAKMMVDGAEVSRGHGHCIHAGDLGIAQAASYAMKRMYINLNGGEM